jgi:peptidoglycan/xylan/chitin deacetylase (PgdA/CDA1 family)
MRGILEGRSPAGAAGRDDDAARTARLIFDAELSRGTIAAEHLRTATVLDALRPAAVPPSPVRVVQAAVKNRDGFSASDRSSRAPAAVRKMVLGAAAEAPPRFLVRVDEFPHYLAWDRPDRFGSDAFRRFHGIMRDAGVPYLLAALPRLSRRPLDPTAGDWRSLTSDERAVLRRLPSEEVTIALHGRDHRTRFASPRRHSELCGLDEQRTAALVDEGIVELKRATGQRARVFVAPYNRFDARQWPVLAGRFEIVGGGPESIRLIGIRSSPQWWAGAVYLPAYAPYYGTAAQVLPGVQHSIEAALGLWTPIVLHWGWEADAGWGDLERLAAALVPHAAHWDEFLAAVRRSQ